MRRHIIAAAIFALLAAAATYAQWAPLPSPPPDAALLERNLPSQSGVVLNIPGTTFGAGFEEDSGTVLNWTAPNGNADNMLRFPENLSAAAWTAANSTVAASTTTFPSTQNTLAVNAPMQQVTSTTNTGTVGQAVAIGSPAAGTMFTVSTFVASGTGSIGGTCSTGNATAVSCVQSDGGACATGVSAGTGWASSTAVGATAIRLSFTMSCTGASATLTVFAHGGQYNSTSAAATFGGVQLVRDSVPHPYRSPPVANLLASPSAFDNAAWAKQSGGGPVVPVVTANAALAPDGTLSADQIVFPAVSVANSFSIVVQQGATSVPVGVKMVAAIWLRAAAPTTVNWSIADTGTPVEITTTCSVAVQWTLCSVARTATGAGTIYALLGTDLRVAQGSSQTAMPAATVYAWNATLTRADMDGDNFVQNGTIPVQTITAAYPSGYGGTRKLVDLTGNTGTPPTKGFSWVGPVGFDTNGFTVCVAYNVLTPNPGYDPVMLSHGQSGLAGWYLTLGRVPPNHTFNITVTNTLGGASTLPTTNTAGPGVLNIGCAGLDSTGKILYSKLNGGATATTTMAASIASAACYPLLVGHYVFYPGANCAGGGTLQSGDPDQIAEVWYSSAPWSESSVSQIQASAMANGGSGPLFADDANTKFHAIGNAFAGGAATWGTPHVALTNIGTAAVSATPVPQQTASADALGAFSDANYASFGSGADPMDFTGDFSCCVAYTPTGSVANNPVLFSNGTFNVDGWFFQVTAAGQTSYTQSANALSSVALGGASIGGAINVACFGTGPTLNYMKLNLGVLGTTAKSATTPATTTTAKIGRYSGATFGFAGNIQALSCTLTPPSDSLFTRVQNRVFQQVAAGGQTLTTTRATTASYEVAAGATPPTLFYAPANVARVTPTGLLVEPAATNLVLQSEALNTAVTWVTTGTCTITPNAAIFADGQTSMEGVSCTGAGFVDTQNQAVAVASSTGPWTASTWSAAAAGTASSLTMTMGAGNATGCSCYATDGSPCTATTAGAVGYAYMTHTGTLGPDRLILTCSSTLATTAITVGVHGGQYATSNAAANFGGVQLETGAFATSYIPTTTVTVARNADAVTAANPLLASVGQNWCLAGKVTPESGRAWTASTVAIGSLGTSAGANSARLQANTAGNIVFDVYDSTGTIKTCTTAHGYAAGSTHVVAACSLGGTLSAYSDGAALTCTVTGAGTGIITTQPATGYVGALSAAGSELAGTVRDFKICRGSQAVQDCTR